MRRLKFLLVAIFGAVAFIIGEAFLRRVVAASLCGTLALNSSLCVSSLTKNRDANTYIGSNKENTAANTIAQSHEKSSFGLNEKPNSTLFYTDTIAQFPSDLAAVSNSKKVSRETKQQEITKST